MVNEQYTTEDPLTVGEEHWNGFEMRDLYGVVERIDPDAPILESTLRDGDLTAMVRNGMRVMQPIESIPYEPKKK